MIRIYVKSVSRDARFYETLDALKKLRDIAIMADAAEAKAIFMTDDDFRQIRQSPVFHRFPSKCIAISDGFDLCYYIPALYAANYRCLLSRRRALTLLGHESGRRNKWIDQLKNATFEKRFLYSFVGAAPRSFESAC